MSDDESGMAAVLAEHSYIPSGLRGVSRCACGEPMHGMPGDHRAHVAAALAEAGYGHVGQARAEAATDVRQAVIGYCNLSKSFLSDNHDPSAVGLARGYQDVADKLSAADREAGEQHG